MLSVEINDVKGFMGKLLASDTFDQYLILEAVITKANTFTIDGRLNEEYLSDLNEGVNSADGSGSETSEEEKRRALTGEGSYGAACFGTGDSSGFPRLQSWGNVRQFCYELVKGKTLPVYMKVVLQLSRQDTEKLLARSGAVLSISDVAGLYLNISYDRKGLRCVTGTSLLTFTLDKSIEHEWDETIKGRLAEYE